MAFDTSLKGGLASSFCLAIWELCLDQDMDPDDLEPHMEGLTLGRGNERHRGESKDDPPNVDPGLINPSD